MRRVDRRERDHPLQHRRPRRRRRLADLPAVAVDRHGDARRGGADGRRQAELRRRALRRRSSRSRGRRSAARARARARARSACWPMNRPLSRLTSRPRPISYGVYFCDVDQRLLAAEEVDVDQQQPGLDARDVEREHAGRLDVERPARLPSARPTRATRVLARHPDLVAEIAGVAGARDVDRHAGDRAAASRGSTSARSMSASATARSSARRRRPLQRQRRDLLGDVLDRARRGRRRSAGTSAGSDPPRSSGSVCSASRDTVPSSITLPCSSHHGV